ncbi:MAG: site-2 protease family protein, partial [Acetanaerobacterium sp.]
YYLVQIFDLLAYISTALGVFNLLPIPPLDGSRILGLFLPDNIYYAIMRYEQIIMLAVFALIFTGVLSTPLNYAIGFMYNGLDFLTVPFSAIVRFL